MAVNIKIPPHDDSAEQSLLGAILIDKDAMMDVAEFVRPAYFYKEAHGHIYEAMSELYELHEPIDVVTITAQLKKNGSFKNIGGSSYLSDLLNVVPTSAHAQRYGRIIQENATKRRLVEAAARINELAFKEQGSAQQIVDEAEQEIFAISQTTTRKDFMVIKDALAESFDRLDELHKRAGGLRGVPTGFTDLDTKLAGMQDSNLLNLSGPSGYRKDCHNFKHGAVCRGERKNSRWYFSLEMSKEELVDRLLVSQADIDAWRLKTGKLSDDDFTKLSDAMGELAEAPIYIDDTPGMNIVEMRTKARRLQMEHGVKLFMVDYLQLVDSGRRYDNRVQEVSVISQSLKKFSARASCSCTCVFTTVSRC